MAPGARGSRAAARWRCAAPGPAGRRRAAASARAWSRSRPTAYRDPSDGGPRRSRGGRRPAASARAAVSRSGASRDGAARAAPRASAPSAGTAFSFAPKLAAGDVVGGQYEVVGCLAHGGLGWIYLARDRNVVGSLGRAQGPAQHRRRRRDGRRAGRAALPRRGRAPEHRPDLQLRRARRLERYIVMEYVGGTSLQATILRNGREDNGESPIRCPLAQAIAYMLAILPAFGYLHDQGLLYCDFKPDNVIQTERLAQADRPRRGVPHGRRDQPDLRHGRLPGARDRPDRAHDRLRPLHRRAHAGPAVLRLPRATRGPSRTALPAAGRRPAVRSATTRCYRFLVKGHRPRPRRPVPVGRRDGRRSSSASCARSSPPRPGGPSPAVQHARSPVSQRAEPTRPTTGGALPAPARRRRRPRRRLPGHARVASPIPTRSSSSFAQAPEQTVEVQLRARARSDRGRRFGTTAHDS